MKIAMPAGYRLILFLWTAHCCIPCVSQTNYDSLDRAIKLQIEETFSTTFYENVDSACLEFDRQALLAEKHKRWHLVIQAKVKKAECVFHYHQFERMHPVLENLQALRQRYNSQLDTLDPDFQSRNDIDYMQSMYYYALGDFNRCIANFEKMLQRDKTHHTLDPLYLYGIHSFIGYSHFQLLLYDKAFVHYEMALAALHSLEEGDTNYEQAIVNLYKGTCLEYKGQNQHENALIREALQYYRNAMRLLMRVDNPIENYSGITSAHLRLATAHRLLGSYDSALYYLNRSFRYHPPEDPLRARSYQSMGDVYAEQKMYDKALDFYARSLDATNKNYPFKHFERSTPLFKKSEIFLLQNQYDSALANTHLGLVNIVRDFNAENRSSLPEIDDQANVAKLMEGLALKGKILSEIPENRKVNLTTALECYMKAVELIDKAQSRYPESEFRQTLSAKAQPLFENALDVAFTAYKSGYTDRDYLEIIFTLLESNKSTLAREVVSNTYAEAFAGVPTALLERESLIKGRLKSMQARLYQNPVKEEVESWKKDLYQITTQYDSLVTHIRDHYPQYYQLKYGSTQLSYKEVQNTLRQNTAVVEYFWGDETIFAACLTKDGMVVEKIELKDSFIRDIRQLVEHVSSPNQQRDNSEIRKFAKLSHSIYVSILEPLIENIPEGISSLIIVPDGLLSYLSFDILLTKTDVNATSYATLPYLLKSYAIRNLFTASLVTQTQQKRSYAYDYIGFAPQYTADYKIPSSVRGTTNFAFLLHNTEEVLQASSLFDGITYVNDRATEEKFRSVSGDGKILHLSMHAFTNDYDPSFSGLVFTPQDSTDKESKDGLLHLYELYNLPVSADLAVLSACETGTGKFARGEGIISLGKAFRYAGCNNIVMSLWNVNDKSTAQIMNDFFHNLNDGMEKDEALRQAKLNFLNTTTTKHFTHPFYWSTFVLTGDVQPVSGKNIWWIWISAGALVVVLLLIIFTKRNRFKSENF